MKQPFFIAIGPPKTGTTWLYAMLAKHPQVHLTPIKEIKFFWEKAFINNVGLKQLFFGKHWYFKKKRIEIRERLIHHLKLLIKFKLNLKDFKWDFIYFFGKHDYNWYLNFFDNEKVSGDISPTYCELPEEQISAIQKLNSNVKIIISLRDPVERVWSNAKYTSRNKELRNKKKKFTEDKFLKHFKDQSGDNDYVALIKRWSTYFSEKNIFVFYFEELQNNPAQVFKNVCNFLNVPIIDIGDSVKQRVNKGTDTNISSEYLNILVKLNQQNLEKMANYFTDEYPKNWYKKYQFNSVKAE